MKVNRLRNLNVPTINQVSFVDKSFTYYGPKI